MNRFITFFLVLILNTAAFSQTPEREMKGMLINYKYGALKGICAGLIKQNKADAAVYYYLGEAYFGTADYDSAETAFTQGTKLYPDYPLNYIGLGRVYLHKKDAAAAEAYFDKAFELDYENAAELYTAAAVSYSGYDMKKEAEYFAQALSADKKYVPAYIEQGRAYLKDNNGNEAVASFQKALDYDSASARAALGKGKIFAMIKNYREAENFYNTAVRLDPQYAQPHNELSEIYYLQEEYEKAADAYARFITLSESTPENMKKYGVYLYLAKDYRKAAEVLAQAAASDKADLNTLRLLSYSYTRLDDSGSGIPAFKNYFSAAPQNEVTSFDYEMYAQLLLKAGEDSLTIEALDKAIALDSSKIKLNGDEAVIYFKNKNWTGVITRLEKLVNAGIMNPQQYFDLGKAYLFTKEYAKADSAFAELTLLKPELPLGYLWRAKTVSNLDPDSEAGLAKPHYEKFISLAEKETDKYKKDLTEAYSYLGYFYYLKKDNLNSISCWQKVSALDPENQQAVEALKVLK